MGGVELRATAAAARLCGGDARRAIPTATTVLAADELLLRCVSRCATGCEPMAGQLSSPIALTRPLSRSLPLGKPLAPQGLRAGAAAPAALPIAGGGAAPRLLLLANALRAARSAPGGLPRATSLLERACAAEARAGACAASMLCRGARASCDVATPPPDCAAELGRRAPLAEALLCADVGR